MEKEKWVLCPICNNKTRIKVRPDTVLGLLRTALRLLLITTTTTIRPWYVAYLINRVKKE